MSDIDDRYLYKPLNKYKPFARNIGIIDGPFEYLTILDVGLPLPFTTRMTVVKLKNGDLFLHSPIAFDAALAETLQSLGTVQHRVSPNQFHYAHIGEWSRAFPDAVTWASPMRPSAPARAASTCNSRGNLVRMHRRNGAMKSIRPRFQAGFLEKSSSSTNSQRRSY